MLELIQTIGLGLVLILPLANPLTTVAVFLAMSGNMSQGERNRQIFQASLYVFIIMTVAYYAGQVVMNTFGISIPGLRIAGGLIVAFIGFRMLFPQQKPEHAPEVKSKKKKSTTASPPMRSISPSFHWRCPAPRGQELLPSSSVLPHKSRAASISRHG